MSSCCILLETLVRPRFVRLRLRSAECEVEVVMTCATHPRHKEKTPQGKALMDAYAARLKDVKASCSLSMRRATKTYMLYVCHSVSEYFKVCISISLTFASPWTSCTICCKGIGLPEESTCCLLAKPFSSSLYTVECCFCVLICFVASLAIFDEPNIGEIWRDQD